MNFRSILKTAIFAMALLATQNTNAQMWPDTNGFVSWSDQTNVTQQGNMLVKTAGSSWDAGAFSTESIPANTDGGFKVKINETLTDRVFGVSPTNGGNGFFDIFLCIYFKKKGKFYIYENGRRMAALSYYNSGDEFSIERVGSEVHFRQNGGTFYIAQADPALELFADVSIRTRGATIGATEYIIGAEFDDADNLGNHSATTNISLSDNNLSNDGDAEGLSISDDGDASFSNNVTVRGDVQTGMIKPIVDGEYVRMETLNVMSELKVGTNSLYLGGGAANNHIYADNGDLLLQDAALAPPYNIIMLNGQNTNCGIGVAAPTHKLTVNGGIRVGNTAVANTGAIRWTGVDFEGYDGFGWKSLTAAGGGPDADFTGAGTGKMYASHTTDSVGIGVTNPVEKLEIDGAVKIGNTSGANSGTIRYTGTDFEGFDGTNWLSLTSGGSGTDIDWDFNSSGNMFATDTTDKVGIGTSDPDHKLSVHFASGTGQLLSSGKFARTQLQLFQKDPTGMQSLPSWNRDNYARMSFENAFTANQWLLAGDPYGSNEEGKFEINFMDNGTGEKNHVTVKSNGNVGIGTNDPVYDLDVIGDQNISGNLSIDGHIHGNRTNSSMYITVGDTWEDGPYIRLYGSNATSEPHPGGMSFVVDEGGEGFRFYDYDPTGSSPWDVNMFVGADGMVGIGTTSPSNELEVCGTIRAKEVIVETGWCDYVFEDDYKLRSLEEVESFINENKHLPDIPAGVDIETNGVKLADIASRFMLKIEELTLYMIDQEKRIQSLEANNQALKSELNNR